MPYSVRKNGKQFETISSDTGKVHGTFKSRAAAEAQMRALYANAPPEKESKRNLKDWLKSK